jgi:diguanylate cyclase (GGDEF)-like protein
MSLIRQIWLLLLGTVLLALAGSVTVSVLSARDTLETQLRIKNSDNAATLALSLSQQKGDPSLMALLMTAQFDTGFFRSIRMRDADGGVSFERRSDAAEALKAPRWFVELLAIDSVPGVAQVSDGWRALGSVEVISHTSFAYDDLWQVSLRTAATLAIVGLVAGLLGTLAVMRIRRPLDATVSQAQALVHGSYVSVPEPRVPELRRLTRAMNTMVQRVRAQFESQALLVEALHQQANCDALTGLSNRQHFLGQLSAALQREDGPTEGGLILLRLMGLADVNRALGHVATDRVLTTIAEALKVYSDKIQGCFSGRLNGSDFALCLPVRGELAATARALSEGVRVALSTQGTHLNVATGAVAMLHATPLAELMTAADAALALAESRGGFSVEVGSSAGAPVGSGGEAAWRSQITQALAEGRTRLASFPVVDATGRVLALECPLRIQLKPDGAFETAARWLPLALRSRLTTVVDLNAVTLALEAIRLDAGARCVNLSPASLADSGFAANVRELLRTQPDAAPKLWLEVSEGAAFDHFTPLQELGRQVRPLGARLGLEHAGERLGRIERLLELGLDYVKLDASVVHAVGADAARATFVASTVTMLQGLGMSVYAEGVADAGDARALWDCRVDGLTGPWVSSQAADAMCR